MTLETRKFDAEVGKILHLMIHSLYTNKDIFLRELISNASDACDKLRYQILTNPQLAKEEQALAITITADPKARTLTIADTGIGMSKQELIENLGTIARSGTQAFMEQLTGDSKKDVQLIGQFGVGFYSSFMVADHVVVISKKVGESQAYRWISEGKGEFSIEESEEFTGPHGTRITLHLREGEDDYLDRFRIRHIVTTYSDHIAIPVNFVDEEGKEEVLNSASALWTRSKSDITDEQYQQFYKHVSFAGDDPWMTLHNKNEGTLEYTNLLFIPSRKPFDLFHPDRKARVKLYVKRVFITDEHANVVPAYLRFLRGVVDSEDLPLNISRETLQHNHIIEKIRKSITKRVLSELKKKASEDAEGYTTFWNNFGAAIKEGLCEGMEDRDAILEVCRFHSTHGDELVSITDYMARMKPEQEAIYYLTGPDLAKIKASPQLEGFKKKGIEVLLLTDSVDDFWVNVVHEYKEKAFKSVTRAGIELDKIPATDSKDTAPESEEVVPEDQKEKVLSFLKTNLEGLIKEVTESHKLTDSPVCLAVAEGAMDIRMERFLLEQRQLAAASLKILEVNLTHPIIKQLSHLIDQGDGTKEQAVALAHMLFDQACILEGEPLPDSSAFSKRMNQFILKSLVA